jgi:hypothetical protein
VSRRSLVNIGLAFLVALAALLLYWQPGAESESSFALVSLPAEALERVEIERPGKPAIVLVRSDGQWRLTAPVRGRVDEVALARVLEIARARSPQRMPSAALERFELDRPWARIRFGEQTVEFGTSNALTQELYVRSGDHVYTLPARLAANVPAEPAKVLAHRLFGADERPTGFRLEAFRVLQHDGRWQLDPAPAAVSQDDLARWVDHWRLASSITTQPAAAASARQTIEIDLAGGGHIGVEVLALNPYLVLRRADESLAYHFPARLAEVLLAPPDAVASDKGR